jgi:hypothetical protein
MDQEQLDYLLQSQYLPSTRDLNIGSMGVTPVLLQGTGLQTGTMGANPQLMTDALLQVGSMGANPQLMTDASLQVGSMGANPFRGIQTVFRPNTLPALSDLGGMTPAYGVANEEDVEQVDSLTGEKKSGGLADLFKTLFGFAIPGANFFLNKGRDALGGIRSLNQRLRNTDFGRSKNLMDYLDMKKYGGYQGREDARAATMAQARGIQKKIDKGDFGTRDRSIDRGRGQITSRTTSAPKRSFSKSYSDAKSAFTAGR